MYNYLDRIQKIFTNIVKGFLFLLLIYIIIRVFKCPLPDIVRVINDIIITILFLTSSIFSIFYAITRVIEFIVKNKKGKMKFIKEETKKILIEIVFFFIFILIESFIGSFFIKGSSLNQEMLVASLKGKSIVILIMDVIICTAISEEFTFRFLLYEIIKNKKIYLIVTTFVFAAMHVLDDPNSLIYIWSYIPLSFYLTYRYYKTKIC